MLDFLLIANTHFTPLGFTAQEPTDLGHQIVGVVFHFKLRELNVKQCALQMVILLKGNVHLVFCANKTHDACQFFVFYARHKIKMA